jgi:methylmalonyl-CoA mutase
MTQLFKDFSSTNKQEWLDLIHKELKGESPDLLHKLNPIEEIVLPSYFHRSDANISYSDPGLSPFTRGINQHSNDWHICTRIEIDSESTANKKALEFLMSGSTALQFVATSNKAINFDQLLKDIDLAYIQTSFLGETDEQIAAFIDKAGDFPTYTNLNSLTENKKGKNFTVFAYDVQQAGGTTWQEIAIAAAEGHEYLIEQLDAGRTIDEAAGSIHFVFGVGTKFIYEVAKFRAFRTIWSKIVEAYQPEHNCSKAATITAMTGFTHISLKDPHTNLLRQTTQALSAVIGGIQELIIQPFDTYSTEPNSEFSQRMATNISLLLKEESYLNAVVDPAGGAYVFDELTETIAERAWTLFQEIDRVGGLTNTMIRAKLSTEIVLKAEQRKEQIRSKSEKLIGINIFPNPQEITANWKELPKAWNNLPTLQLEQL